MIFYIGQTGKISKINRTNSEHILKNVYHVRYQFNNSSLFGLFVSLHSSQMYLKWINMQILMEFDHYIQLNITTALSKIVCSKIF